MASRNLSANQQKQGLKTGPEYHDLVHTAKKATAALKHEIFNVNKGPLPADHPLWKANYAAHDAVTAHLEHHNPNARAEASIMGGSDPIHWKAMSDTSSVGKQTK